MQRSAVISACGLYRYRLARVLDDLGPTMMFLMVNPSTADAESDDQTIRKCIGFAKRHGYGRIFVGNKFAYRATDIDDLPAARDPVGPDNDGYLRGMFSEANVVIAAWGSLNKLPEALQTRWRAVVRMADDFGITLHCFGTNNDKHPRHPLTLGYDTPISRWEAPWFAGRKKP